VERECYLHQRRRKLPDSGWRLSGAAGLAGSARRHLPSGRGGMARGAQRPRAQDRTEDHRSCSRTGGGTPSPLIGDRRRGAASAGNRLQGEQAVAPETLIDMPMQRGVVSAWSVLRRVDPSTGQSHARRKAPALGAHPLYPCGVGLLDVGTSGVERAREAAADTSGAIPTDAEIAAALRRKAERETP
jgi:hypothetical protein